MNSTFQPINSQLILDQASNYLTSQNIGHTIHARTIKGVSMATIRLDRTFMDPTGSQFQPQLFLKNANDGTSACHFSVGLFRLVCSNGLVIPGAVSETYRIIHRVGPKSKSFIDSTHEIIERTFEPIFSGHLENELERLDSIELTDEQGIEAIASLNLSDSLKYMAIKMWLSPIRNEEQHRSLYVLSNVVNETVRLYSRLSIAGFDRNIRLIDDLELLTTGSIAA
jgi:hypothetical protein